MMGDLICVYSSVLVCVCFVDVLCVCVFSECNCVSEKARCLCVCARCAFKCGCVWACLLLCVYVFSIGKYVRVFLCMCVVCMVCMSVYVLCLFVRLFVRLCYYLLSFCHKLSFCYLFIINCKFNVFIAELRHRKSNLRPATINL